MPGEKLMKITCHLPPQKHNSYLRMPSPTFAFLKRELEMYLFTERQLPQFEMRIYWIDTDFDEIEIINQTDYEICMSKYAARGKDMHLHITTMTQPESATAPKTVDAAASTGVGEGVKTNPDDPANFIIHDNVSCDACGLAPLIGFRYKCIQCPNYDLCQRCEAGHKHSDHVMLRLPSNNSPSLVDAWITGPGVSSRRRSHHHKRAAKMQCPFAEATGFGVPPATGEASGAGVGAAESGEGRHHGRKHHKRHMRNGFFSQIYDIIQDLAESGVPPTNVATENVAANTEDKTQTTASEAVGKEQSKAAPDVEVNNATTELSSPVTEPAVEKAEGVTAPFAAPKPAPRQTEQPDNAAIKEPQQSSKKDEPNTPVIDLGSLAQAVPPEYMRAGIEILNNFSEMFAKMLDPAEGADMGVPSPLNTRKNSTTSSVSSTSNSTKNSQATAPAAKQQDVQIPPAVVPDQTNSEPQVPAQNATTSLTLQMRANSEDGDWQVIGVPNTSQMSPSNTPASNGSFADLQNETSEVGSITSNSETVKDTVAPNANINFAQLSADLRAHVKQEEAREQQSQQSTPQGSITNSQQTQTAQEPSVSTSTASTNTNEPEPETERPKPPQEKRTVPIYHTDERINNAVHAMMAMGFSNEGAWLTQLLESVNGNIAHALDCMSNSQRNSLN